MTLPTSPVSEIALGVRREAMSALRISDRREPAPMGERRAAWRASARSCRLLGVLSWSVMGAEDRTARPGFGDGPRASAD